MTNYDFNHEHRRNIEKNNFYNIFIKQHISLIFNINLFIFIFFMFQK